MWMESSRSPGLIGPTRMAYDRVIPIVDATAGFLVRHWIAIGVDRKSASLALHDLGSIPIYHG